MAEQAKMAIDIEQLVTWALRDQGLGWLGRESTQLGTLMDLGTMIDRGYGGSHPTIGLLSDDDALLVREEIDTLPLEQRGLLVQYGRAGLRPEGADEAIGVPEQLLNKRGQPRWDYDDPKNRRGARRPLLDVLGWSQKRDMIMFAREQWTLWRDGLVALIAPLNRRMATHHAIGPMAPAEPWNETKPIVHGLDAVEPSAEPQPWLKPAWADEKPRDADVEQLRDEAQATVRKRAQDWSVPADASRQKHDGLRRN